MKTLDDGQSDLKSLNISLGIPKMSYVSKREKVFDLPEQEAETSTISLQNTETRLKRFPSVSDRRAWTTEEYQRYQHLYGLINGSEVRQERPEARGQKERRTLPQYRT